MKTVWEPRKAESVSPFFLREGGGGEDSKEGAKRRMFGDRGEENGGM